jgi:cytidine deaminase
VAKARTARERAYAPYSNFLVGAAVATGAGVFTGANVENASYGLAICAERVAAATAVASGARSIDAVAVVGALRDPGTGKDTPKEPTPPCGACRQFLYEFNRDMIVVSEGKNGVRKRWRLADLLVDGFGPENLESAG